MTLEELRLKAANAVQALVDRVRPRTRTVNGITFPIPGPFKPTKFHIDTSARSGEFGDHETLVMIQPGDSYRIQRRFDFRCRVEGLTIVPGLARYFDVCSLKVGRDEQLYGTIPVPASAFSNTNLTAPGLRTKEVPTSLYVTLTVRNVGKRPHRFRAMYACVTVEDECR